MRFREIATAVVLLTLLKGTPRRAWTQVRQPQYSSIAAIDQYLMTDRSAEVSLARSAAPAAISSKAKILVLGRRGYETSVVRGGAAELRLLERRALRAEDGIAVPIRTRPGSLWK
ncbi:MAG: hypothetical protein ACJ72H_21630 [Candidatus Sulfotelmatobacter sp.]